MSTDTLVRLPAPRITATMLAALITPDAVIVQDADGRTFALPEGMTAIQAEDPTLVVVLTEAEAADYLRKANGKAADAARAASAVLSSLHDRGLL